MHYFMTPVWENYFVHPQIKKRDGEGRPHGKISKIYSWMIMYIVKLWVVKLDGGRNLKCLIDFLIYF